MTFEIVDAPVKPANSNGTAAHVLQSCGFDALWPRSEDEAVHMAVLRPALATYRDVRGGLDPITAVMADALVVERMTGLGWQRWDAGKMIRAVVSTSGAATVEAVPRTLAEMLADPELEDEAEWLVPGYVGRGILTLVSGHPKVGKTTFLAHLAMAVVSGSPFLGMPTTEAPVLWVDLEQHPRRLTALFKMLIADSYKGFSCAESISTISTRPSLEQLAEMITKTGAGLVVVDSLFKLLGVEDENDATAVNQAMAPLLDMTRETNVALVPIHHLRKSGGSENTDVRGSSAINAIVDISFAIRRLKDGSDTSRELEAISRYSDTPARLVVELKDGTYHRLGTVAEVRAERNEARVLEVLTEEPATAAVIGDAAGLKEGTARKALNALHGKGLVSREGTGKKGNPFQFTGMKMLSAQEKPIGEKEKAFDGDPEGRYPELFELTGTEG